MLDDTHQAFAAAAAEDGVVLGRQTFDWLCEQGHVGLERVAKARRDPALVAPVMAALKVLGAIFARLKGDVSVLHASRENLTCPSTWSTLRRARSSRSTAPRTSARCAYRARPVPDGRGRRLRSRRAPRLCRECAPPTDGLSRGIAAKGFGFGGVPRERAYRDALRDLATPAMGHPPLVRIAATDGDGAAACAPPRPPRAAARRGAPQQIGWSGSGSTATLMVRQRRSVRAPSSSCRPGPSPRPAGCRSAADVVVRPVAVEDGPVGVLLDRGAAVHGLLVLVDVLHRDRRHGLRAFRPCR